MLGFFIMLFYETMDFLTCKLFCFSANAQLIDSKNCAASTWLAVAEFDLPSQQNDINKTNATFNSKDKKKTHPHHLAKRDLHRLQQQMVRVLLQTMLDKLNIVDTLDSSRYPYRLHKHQYFVSFSHSQNWVACAMSQNTIGVDIEKSPINDTIFQRYFHPNATTQLMQLNGQKKDSYKQISWMLAEALLKKNQGKQLATYLRYDFTDAVSDLMKQMTCNNAINNAINNTINNASDPLSTRKNTDYCSVLLRQSAYTTTPITSLCSGIIYLPTLSVLVAF